MRLVTLLLSPAIVGLGALFLSIIWMLRNEKDKVRPMLVMALTLNLFYGFLMTHFMGKEGSLLPWKYDYVLFHLDRAIGIQAAPIALSLQAGLRVPLIVIYELMVPMMICWYLVTAYRGVPGSVVLAYVSELIAGPILYAVLPACGPVYAFKSQWLQSPSVPDGTIQFAGIPNAFPSLHLATAFVFVLFAPGKFWKAVSLLFLAGTAMATLSTGEHYVIDLVAGLAFGCFAAAVGYRKSGCAAFFIGVVLAWALAIRFGYAFLIVHPILIRTLAVLTVLSAIFALVRAWKHLAVTAHHPGQHFVEVHEAPKELALSSSVGSPATD
jgi:PAP2 superfamily